MYIILALEAIFYFLLAIYFDVVLPDENGEQSGVLCAVFFFALLSIYLL